DSSGVAPASPQVAYRALLERAGSREPADRGGVDGIGPRHIGLRLACSKALERFLALMGHHLARPKRTPRSLARLRPSPVGGAEGRKCGQLFSVEREGVNSQRKPTRLSPPLARRLTRPRKRSAAMKRSGEWRSSMLTARAFAKVCPSRGHAGSRRPHRGPKMRPTFFGGRPMHLSSKAR